LEIGYPWGARWSRRGEDDAPGRIDPQQRTIAPVTHVEEAKLFVTAATYAGFYLIAFAVETEFNTRRRTLRPFDEAMPG